MLFHLVVNERKSINRSYHFCLFVVFFSDEDDQTIKLLLLYHFCLFTNSLDHEMLRLCVVNCCVSIPR